MTDTKLDDETIREIRRAERKFTAQARARLSYQHALERIDHQLDVLEPGRQEIRARGAQGEIPREITKEAS
jgi:hypothetical protein